MDFETSSGGESHVRIPPFEIYSMEDIGGEPISVTRIKWEDGSWWDVLSQMPYGVASKVRRRSIKVGLQDTAAMGEAIEDVHHIRLEGCSVAWSFGEDRPTLEQIMTQPQDRVRVVLKVMNDLYREDTRQPTDDEKKRQPSPSSTADPSLNNGVAPVNTSASSTPG